MTNLTPNVRYWSLDIDDLTANDLREEGRNFGGRVECAGIEIDGKAEHAQCLYMPEIGRAGIAWGADAAWTDAASIEDAIERYLTDNMIS